MHFTHEALGPGLHQFRFPSTSRRGVTHILTFEPGANVPAERLMCSCDASMFNQLCKHKRFILHGRRAA